MIQGVMKERPLLEGMTAVLKHYGCVGLTYPRGGCGCTCELGPGIGTHCGGTEILDCHPVFKTKSDASEESDSIFGKIDKAIDEAASR